MSKETRLQLDRAAWLIAYDIADARRLGRVHRFLKREAMPIQYSVFLGWFGEGRLQRLVSELEELIDRREDDVRLYHLPAGTELMGEGRQWFPEGAQLLFPGTAAIPGLTKVNAQAYDDGVEEG